MGSREHDLAPLPPDPSEWLDVAAMTFLVELGEVAVASNLRVRKPLFVRWALPELRCSLCTGNARIHAAAGLRLLQQAGKAVLVGHKLLPLASGPDGWSGLAFVAQVCRGFLRGCATGHLRKTEPCNEPCQCCPSVRLGVRRSASLQQQSHPCTQPADCRLDRRARSFKSYWANLAGHLAHHRPLRTSATGRAAHPSGSLAAAMLLNAPTRWTPRRF